jgi:hypothetical protein
LAVVGICATADGEQAGVELLPSGRAHGRSGECEIEFQPFFGQAVYVGRVHVTVSVTACV